MAEVAGAGPGPTINGMPEPGRGRSDPGLTTSTSGRNSQTQPDTARHSPAKQYLLVALV